MSDSRQSRSNNDSDLYQILDELDRLEELLEDMADLGVSSRAEAEERMRKLNAVVDELEG